MSPAHAYALTKAVDQLLELALQEERAKLNDAREVTGDPRFRSAVVDQLEELREGLTPWLR